MLFATFHNTLIIDSSCLPPVSSLLRVSAMSVGAAVHAHFIRRCVIFYSN